MEHFSVPGIVKWDRYAGGIAALEGTYSYGLTTEIGNYKIWPPERRGDGYVLLFENVKGVLGGGLNQPIGHEGELQFLPLKRARSPQEAAKWAKKHYELHHEASRRPNPASVTLGQVLVALGLTGISIATVVAGVRLGRQEYT